LLLDHTVGPDPADPGSSARPRRHFGDQLGEGVRGLRVGFVRHFHEVDTDADPEVGAALEEAARILVRDGAEVRTVALPRLQEFAGVNRVILHSEAWSVHADWLRSHPDGYGRLGRRSLMTGAFFSAGDYVQAQRRRFELIRAVEAALREVDILMTANSMDPACRIDDEAIYARNAGRQARTPFTVTGHPALAMMSGLSSTGLPLSVQFARRYHDEATLLRLAAAYERATSWHSLHPPAFAGS
jgi:aspartyl-tRNA(Asn)/glutamyl-tRNA(Gln) amidotransferase subunit A